MIGRMIVMTFGLAIMLVGGIAFLGGLAVTVLGFPFGAVLGLPITLVGGVIAGAGVSVIQAAASDR